MSMSLPKVSIIVPVYNVEKYVKRCIESICTQTFKDIEIIIVNDGSKDSSFEICKNIAEKDSRIKMFSKKNEGLGYTRNFGLDKAVGDFVTFIDSDDYIEKEYIEKIYEKITKDNSDACFANIKLLTIDKKIVSRDRIPFKKDCISSQKMISNMLHKADKEDYGTIYMGISATRAIYKRKILKDKNIRFESEKKYLSEDLLFNVEFCLNSNLISLVPNAYYYYCYNEQSLSHTYRADRFEKSKVLYEELITRLSRYKIYDEFKSSLASIFIGYVRASIKQEIFQSKKNSRDIKFAIKKIINDKKVVEALKIKSKEKKIQNIFDFFLKIKSEKLVMLAYKLSNKRENKR